MIELSSHMTASEMLILTNAKDTYSGREKAVVARATYPEIKFNVDNDHYEVKSFGSVTSSYAGPITITFEGSVHGELTVVNGPSHRDCLRSLGGKLSPDSDQDQLEAMEILYDLAAQHITTAEEAAALEQVAATLGR